MYGQGTGRDGAACTRLDRERSWSGWHIVGEGRMTSDLGRGHITLRARWARHRSPTPGGIAGQRDPWRPVLGLFGGDRPPCRSARKWESYVGMYVPASTQNGSRASHVPLGKSMVQSTCVLYMAGILAEGLSWVCRRIMVLAGLAYPWQCGGGWCGSRLCCCATGARRSPTGGGQRPKATNRPQTMLLSSAGDPSLIAPARPSKLAGLARVGCSARPTAVCHTTVFCRTRSRQRCSVGS